MLTYSPCLLLAMRVCLLHRFTVHLVATLDCVRYAVGHFEMMAESPINHESRGYKLQTNGVSGPRRVLKKEILTLRAATKGSLHKPPVSSIFAHSLKSSVGGGERMFVSRLFAGAERHRCKKSVTKWRMHSGRTG